MTIQSALCLDVQYYQQDGQDKGHVAAGYASTYTNPRFTNIYGLVIDNVLPYEPGSFYKRELPCIEQILNKIDDAFDLVIIDGYVYLDNHNGLGFYVYELLNRILPVGGVPVIGVAKTAYKGSDFAKKLTRGSSNSPLFITSIGINPDIALDIIKEMHGSSRIPTLLKEIDRAARNLTFVNL